MNNILFHILYGLIWLISLLPFGILYAFSDLAYLMVYHVLRYRRKTVAENLKTSFPDKNDMELKNIEKRFYHNFCDIFIESIKVIHFNKRQMMKRMTMENPEVFDDLYKKQKDAIIVLGHYGNWEWLTAIPCYAMQKSVSIYKPLSDKCFDRLMKQIRTHTGASMVPMNLTVREIINNKKARKTSLYLSIADQTPPVNKIHYRIKFLNQDTPVYTGTEKIAKKYDMAVLFLNIKKRKRGYYTFSVDVLVEDASDIPENMITDTYFKRLENQINEQPELWLWSHRRWKYKAAHD